MLWRAQIFHFEPSTRRAILRNNCRARSNAGPRPSSQNVLVLFAAARAVLSVIRFFVHHFSGSDNVATSGAIVKECHTHNRLVCLRRSLSRRRGRVCAHTHKRARTCARFGTLAWRRALEVNGQTSRYFNTCTRGIFNKQPNGSVLTTTFAGAQGKMVSNRLDWTAPSASPSSAKYWNVRPPLLTRFQARRAVPCELISAVLACKLCTALKLLLVALDPWPTATCTVCTPRAGGYRRFCSCRGSRAGL